MLVLAGLDVVHCKKHSKINSFLSDTDSTNIIIFKISVFNIHMPNYPLETMFVHPIWGGGVNGDCSLSYYVTGQISIQMYHLCCHVFKSEATSCAACVDIAAVTAGY